MQFWKPVLSCTVIHSNQKYTGISLVHCCNITHGVPRVQQYTINGFYCILYRSIRRTTWHECLMCSDGYQIICSAGNITALCTVQGCWHIFNCTLNNGVVTTLCSNTKHIPLQCLFHKLQHLALASKCSHVLEGFRDLLYFEGSIPQTWEMLLPWTDILCFTVLTNVLDFQIYHCMIIEQIIVSLQKSKEWLTIYGDSEYHIMQLWSLCND